VKFDQALPEVTKGEKETLLRTLTLRPNQPILIAGSTHSGEEEVILKVHRDLSHEYPDLVLILAPRHLERLGEVECSKGREFHGNGNPSSGQGRRGRGFR
jgi:3-deoxy-D-manno-octulosonic-acid transferase